MFTNFTEELNSQFVLKIQNLKNFNSLSFYYIIEAYEKVMGDYYNYHDAWIYENDESWCVGFWIDGNYFLNSNNLSENDLKIINNRINFKHFKQDGFHFAGNTELVDSLSEINTDFELEEFKERYFFALDKVNNENNLSNKISLIDYDDVDEIAILYQQYYVEEYQGTNNKQLEVVKDNIYSLITRNLMYKLEIDNEIIGFCTKMTFLSDTPNMIGTIFIQESNRNKKYAQNLLRFVSNIMLKENQEIYLMTTKQNTASNKMVERVGFLKKYDHSDRIIKNYG